MTTTLTSLIKSLKFNYVNSDIEEHFTYEAPRSADYKLFHFGRDIKSEDAVKEIEKEGYSPATLLELLAYAKDGWNNEDWVVALGSVAEVRLSRSVPYLAGRDAGRSLRLGWWGGRWLRDYRFLAVRTLSSGTQASTMAPSPSDSLSLEARVEKLEAFEKTVRAFLILP